MVFKARDFLKNEVKKRMKKDISHISIETHKEMLYASLKRYMNYLFSFEKYTEINIEKTANRD